MALCQVALGVHTEGVVAWRLLDFCAQIRRQARCCFPRHATSFPMEGHCCYVFAIALAVLQCWLSECFVSAATASVAIHKAELKEIIDAALTLP